MLHYYFRTKENLYGHVIAGALRRILNQVGQAWLSQDSVESRLERVVDAYMDNYERIPGSSKSFCENLWTAASASGKCSESSKTWVPGFRGYPPQIMDRIGSELA